MVSKVQFLKLGREGHETLIDGASPWAHKWAKASSSAFITKHLSYPNQSYAVYFYEMTAHGRTVWFGAGKIEDGIWAFYR